MKLYSFMYYVLLLPGAFLAPVIHESVKARCSARLGDPTPKRNGFLSGNPFRYFEPVGFLCMMMFGYGWGRPVATSPMYYKDRRRGVMITFITPAVVNLLVGLITSAALGLFTRLVWPAWYAALPTPWALSAVDYVYNVLYLFASCNIGLALFNILPVYPLDGSKILQLLLKPDWAVKVNQYEKIIQVALLVLLGLGFLQRVLDPVRDLLISAVMM